MSTPEEAVAAWIRNHGYPLELRVAEILRTNGVHATHHRVYQDLSTGKVREIDVMGYLDAKPVSLHLILECKHSHNKPWLLFCTSAPTLTAQGYPVSVPSTPAASKIVRKLATRPAVQRMAMFAPKNLVGFRLAKAHTDNQDAAFHAVQGITSACLATARDIGSDGHSVIFLPVIIVDAPLFQCHLPHAEAEIQISRVPRGVLLHTYEPGEFALVHVVHVDELPAFIGELRKDADRLARLAARTA